MGSGGGNVTDWSHLAREKEAGGQAGGRAGERGLRSCPGHASTYAAACQLSLLSCQLVTAAAFRQGCQKKRACPYAPACRPAKSSKVGISMPAACKPQAEPSILPCCHCPNMTT